MINFRPCCGPVALTCELYSRWYLMIRSNTILSQRQKWSAQPLVRERVLNVRTSLAIVRLESWEKMGKDHRTCSMALGTGRQFYWHKAGIDRYRQKLAAVEASHVDSKKKNRDTLEVLHAITDAKSRLNPVICYTRCRIWDSSTLSKSIDCQGGYFVHVHLNA